MTATIGRESLKKGILVDIEDVYQDDPPLLASTIPQGEDEVNIINNNTMDVSTRSDVRFIFHRVKWSFSLFWVFYGLLYWYFQSSTTVNRYDSDQWDRRSVLINQWTFADSWFQLGILGLYTVIAAAKAREIQNNMPPIDHITSLVSAVVKNPHERSLIIKRLLLALSSVFSVLSPMVRKQQSQDAELLNETFNHSSSIKSALDVIQEARGRGEVDHKYYLFLVTDINAVQMKCDRLVRFKQQVIGTVLSAVTLLSIYSFTAVWIIREHVAEGDFRLMFYVMGITAFLLVSLSLFAYAEQHLKPFSDAHDVYGLRRFLTRRTEIISYVMDKTMKQN